MDGFCKGVVRGFFLEALPLTEKQDSLGLSTVGPF